MADATIAWDSTNNRGDWVFNAPSVTQTSITVSSPVQFAVGDGVATQFSLLPAQNQISSIVAQIYRNDWQGNQLLYATPRTNLVTQSQAFDNAAWTKGNMAVTTAATTAPDGTNTGEKLADNDSVSSFKNIQHATTSASAAQTFTQSVYAKVADRQYLLMRIISTSASSNYVSAYFDLVSGVCAVVNSGAGTGAKASIAAIGNGWFRCTLTGQPDVANTGIGALIAGPLTYTNSTSYVGVLGQGVYIWGAQLEVSNVATSYIPTTISAVTVTDYTLSASGSVALATAPVISAQLTWTGSYVLNTFNGGGCLATGDDLQTAIIISLFSDRMAQPGDVIPDGSNDPRGWWADGAVPIGSRMWLLRRSKQIPETSQLAYTYIAEALQWLIDDGVVAQFDISVQWPSRGVLDAQITAYKQDGTTLMTGLFTWAWNGINV
jgi:phage gp46-like protein